MATTNHVIELDIPKLIEANASHSVTCDSCGAKLGERYSNKRHSLSVPLKKATAGADGEDTPDYDAYAESHFCNEDCLHDHLVTRKSSKSKKK